MIEQINQLLQPAAIYNSFSAYHLGQQSNLCTTNTMPSIKVHDIVVNDPPLKNLNEDADSGKVRKRTISQQITDNDKSILPVLDNISSKSDHSDHTNGFMASVAAIQTSLEKFYSKNGHYMNVAIGIIILILYNVYLAYVIYLSFSRALALVVMTIVGWLGVIYYFWLKPNFGPSFEKGCIQPMHKATERIFRYNAMKGFVIIGVLAAIAIFLAFDTSNDRYRLVSLSGLTFYLLVLFVFSNDPAKIRWRPVLCGLLLQFTMGMIVLRWPIGSMAFNFASNQFTQFMSYTQAGTSFVYGWLAIPPPICGFDPIFAFSTIQTTIYFSAVISLLYYLGIMQYVIKLVGWIMASILGTSAVESLNAAGNIFLGMTEAPLMIRPYLPRMTDSEIFAMMTSGFGTVAGSVFAAYISFGACPNYLLSATVMSATGSLAVSKLFYPETQESKCKKVEDLDLPKGQESNVLEAISNGASNGIFLVANIVANLLVFLALLAFFDSTLTWLGDMAGIEDLTFEKLCSYAFFPLAYMMGAGQDPNDVMKVAELMGIKTFLNEFIAYQKMGEYIKQGVISPRAQVVATYALCGFSNLGSIGIQLGVFSAMCPDKKQLFAKVVLRACIAGSITTFMTACIAGLLTTEPQVCGSALSSSNCTCLDPGSPYYMQYAPSC